MGCTRGFSMFLYSGLAKLHSDMCETQGMTSKITKWQFSILSPLPPLGLVQVLHYCIQLFKYLYFCIISTEQKLDGSLRLEVCDWSRPDGLGLRESDTRLGQPDPQQPPKKLFQVSSLKLHASIQEKHLQCRVLSGSEKQVILTFT